MHGRHTASLNEHGNNPTIITKLLNCGDYLSLFPSSQAYVHKSVVDELKRIVEDSEVMQEDDEMWPQPDRVGRQELEIVMGDEHISFTTSKIGSLIDVNNSR